MGKLGERAMAAVIDELLDAGFEPDGQTREEIVRVPTANSPVLGRSGGELAKFGGRQRFSHRSTSVKVTVGARTVCFYRSEPGQGLQGVQGIATLDTKALVEIRGMLASVVKAIHSEVINHEH